MKRCLILLVLGLFLVPAVWAAPRIVAEKMNFNFGEILQGEQVEHIFRFKNDGDSVLQLGSVRSSCGCTAALLSATRIAPGDTAELRTTFDSARFEGAISKLVTVDTNDPDKPQAVFGIQGHVKAELQVSPDRVNWGRVAPDTPLESTVQINNKGNGSVRLQRPEVSNPAVRAELDTLELAPGERTALRLFAALPEGQKRVGGYVIISTDHPRVPQLRVSVSARLAK